MPAQSSRSIGFLMPVGSSLTLCGIICNNNAMLSPGFLRYDPSKSNYGLLVTIVPSVWGGDPPIFVYRCVLECKNAF